MFVPWALLLILYAVYCCMFVPWALPHILFAVYCHMFVPWALPLILFAVYCRMFVHGHCHLYCMLCTVTCLCNEHCCLSCMLCTATCLCHKHCTVTVNCLMWQCCLTLYVVHTLPPGFPLWALLLYMEYYVTLGALRMCCPMTDYCECWSDTMRFYTNLVLN